MFNTTWLYIKRHSVTGLLFFGKTTKNPKVIKGNGIYWLHHLKTYGESYVETLCIKRFTNKTKLSRHVKAFHARYEVKNSERWANYKSPDTFRPKLENKENRFHFIYKTTNLLNGKFYKGKQAEYKDRAEFVIDQKACATC